ncbi:MAG: hypothetical protein NVSMB64_04250 [Candidatus Velthaea sp.]
MRSRFAAAIVAAGCFLSMSGTAQSQGEVNDAAIIASAMSAGPPSVAQAASIMAITKDGSMRMVRKGTNGFTCMPDNPTTPGIDPMCLDTNAMEWAGAWMKHATPPDKVGFIYMLAGGSDASNTDPYAQSPAAGNHWITSPPHVMIVGAAASTMAGYPAGADPTVSQPFVMWAGTPYAHLMIPVK